MNHFNSNDGRCRRGSVVVLVLGMILLVSGLMTAFIARTGDDLIAASRNSAESRLRREAYSALETTLAVLVEFIAVDGALHAPEQGWKEALAYAGASLPPDLQVAIGFEDETGKLSLPAASPASVRMLLESSGINPAKAQSAADAMLAWMHPDLGPSDRSSRPGRSFDEMASIAGLRELVTDRDGRPNEVWRRIERASSMHPLASVNLNTATAAALHAMAWTEPQIAALQQARTIQPQAGGYARSAGNLLPMIGAGLPAGTFGTTIELLRIRVAVSSGALTYRLEAVVSPRSVPSAEGLVESRDLRYPFHIVEFREDAVFPEQLEDST